MAEKGFLSKEQEQQFAQFLDDLIDFTKFKGIVWKFVELADGKLFQVAVTYLDDSLGDKIPAGIKDDAALFMVAVVEKDVEKVKLHGQHIINRLVDIPYLTEESEAILISSLIDGLVLAIMTFFDKDQEDAQG